jgi:alpha-beta hydrolase superfamily lysophospholipase
LTPTSGFLNAQDGARLYWQRWDPSRPSRATVCLVHGHGEHIGRYNHVARAFQDARVTMIGSDLRGHGQTPGPRGDVPSYERLLDDVDLLISMADPSKPVFLYGHSMGGNIALQYGLRRTSRLHGVIVTGAWLRLRYPTPPLQRLMARIMPSILPGFTVASGLNVNGLSRDPAVVRAYVEDPLVHDRISARLGSSILNAGEDALAHAAEFRLPVLFMHGADDPIVDPAAVETFYREASSTDKTFRLWTGLRHEIHNEPEQADVLKVMVEWVVARL